MEKNILEYRGENWLNKLPGTTLRGKENGVLSMPLGRIDFSKSERKKFAVFWICSRRKAHWTNWVSPPSGTVLPNDFPGTSTIQTRAKYFLIVPYALKELDRGRDFMAFILRNDRREILELEEFRLLASLEDGVPCPGKRQRPTLPQGKRSVGRSTPSSGSCPL